MARDRRIHTAETYQGKKGSSIMAQTPHPEETTGGETGASGTGRPQGLLGGSTTILLVVFAVAVFWWSRRRRLEMEEELRAQRREAEATAERSALDVAHLMRAAPQPGAGVAAAREGLAAAARIPSAHAPEPNAGGPAAAMTRSEAVPNLGGQEEARAREIERAQARAAAERAAEEQAERASQAARSTGESLLRRTAAASSAAEEAAADTVDAAHVGPIAAVPEVAAQERKPPTESQEVIREPLSSAVVPAGAIPGDGTATCPPDYPIKGNRQSRIYHRPGQVSYPSTVAEYCFSSETAAESAGFRQSRARGQRPQSS
jgi:hypothetical protein